MSKKQVKKISKKSLKKSKSKPVSKPMRLSTAKVKPAKKGKAKSATKPSGKVSKSAKSSNKSKRKPIAKPTRPSGGKVSKLVKKVSAKKKVAPKKIVKSAKKIIAKKITLKKVVKKAIKPARPLSGKVTKKVIVKTPVKPIKTAKEEKVIKEKVVKLKLLVPVKAEKFDKTKAIKEKPLKPKGKGGRKPKSKDDDEPEIVHDALLEEIIKITTKRSRKEPKVPKILKTFVNPAEILSAALIENTGKKGSIPKKEPKGKFELEYVVRTSASILYEFLTTPSGLSEWFADDVNIRDGIFTFYWDGSEQKAKLIGFKEEKFLRLKWLDKPDGYYFEFRIERDELTGDISLMIVDFADESSDLQTSKLLWDSQINKLLHVLGSN